jgi:hypothetical protein
MKSAGGFSRRLERGRWPIQAWFWLEWGQTALSSKAPILHRLSSNIRKITSPSFTPLLPRLFLLQPWTLKLRCNTVVATAVSQSGHSHCETVLNRMNRARFSLSTHKAAPQTGQPLVLLNYLGGREKQKFEHLRETKDLALACAAKQN